MSFIYDFTDTWNDAGTVFNGIKLNVTNTASADNSALLRLQIGDSDYLHYQLNEFFVKVGVMESILDASNFIVREGNLEAGLRFNANDGYFTAEYDEGPSQIKLGTETLPWSELYVDGTAATIEAYDIGDCGFVDLVAKDHTATYNGDVRLFLNPEEGFRVRVGIADRITATNEDVSLVAPNSSAALTEGMFQVFNNFENSGFRFDFVNNEFLFYDQAEAAFVGVFSFGDGQLNCSNDLVVESLAAAESLSGQRIWLSAQEAYSLTATANLVALPEANKIKLSSTAAYEIRGFEVGDITPLYLLNTGSFNITLIHNSASAPSVTQRILSTTGANIVLTPGRVVEMTYIDSRWRAWLC